MKTTTRRTTCDSTVTSCTSCPIRRSWTGSTNCVTQVVRPEEGRIVLGWIGGKDSVDALYGIYEPLERLFAKHARRAEPAPADSGCTGRPPAAV